MFDWLQGLPSGAPALIGTLTGSFLGLIALILGALFNFHLNRKRDDRIRRQEACSVAAALYGEILLLRRELAGVGHLTAIIYLNEHGPRNPLMKFDRHFLEKCKLPNSTQYNALASNLGLLNTKLIVSIIEFYAKYEEVRKWLPLLLDDEDRRYTYSPTAVLHPVRDAVQDVVPALRSIERMIKINDMTDDIELSEVLNAIEMEKLQHAPFDE